LGCGAGFASTTAGWGSVFGAAAFLRGAEAFPEAGFFSSVGAAAFTGFFFAAAAGLEGLTAGFATLFLGADLGMVFFAAMAQR